MNSAACSGVRRERMNTPEWPAKLMAGDFQTQREATLISIVLASRIIEEN
jgi:hypothetical protein